MSTQLTPTRLPDRTYRTFFMDSTHWERYEPRPGDIVVCTPAKVGTTWTQRIVSVLVFQDTELPQPLMALSPWLECNYVPLDVMTQGLAAQTHRRFMKSHLPLDALPFYSEVSYLIVGRDLRDAVLSTHNHALGLQRSAHEYVHRPEGEDVHTPEEPVITEDLAEYWRQYFTRSPFPWESNGWPYNSPTHHLASWWEYKDEPNVLFLHYQDMLDDLDKEMRRVSAFLGIPVDEAVWPRLVDACTFSSMKGGQDRIFPEQLKSSLSTFEFFHKGTNGRWQDAVPAELLDLYHAAMAPLPQDLRVWLARSA
ncbi:sulfotransferase domain-containing protein [Streptomyces sp. 7-21]|jgi:aryl sulfotransferase|uniref:sulfotransferase domain-containing protein n=1 Tax=Streptomyces sp. 7-21 TaxID=2802283 RepID=UPI00191DD6BB|nr:sulfotransferase domain-containing protein [Streptomyces sp. 7-21]MBL1065849.1 sulfotransferase domain-containing protein [Streptomyces sp. 7-21]